MSRAATIHPPRKASPADMRAIAADLIRRSNVLLDQAEAAHALVTINHPGLPSGEACMGCGWTAPVDFARIAAVEAVNGGISAGPLSGIPFWEARLNAGLRTTAVGGSDNHDAALEPARAAAGRGALADCSLHHQVANHVRVHRADE